MFLKKLMCLVLSLAFSISPILSNPIVFSSDSFDFLDLSDLSDDYYSGGEEEEEEEEEEDWDKIDEAGNEALEISLEAVNASTGYNKIVSSESITPDIFIFFWNYLVKKYVFELSYSIHGQLYFESNPLCLNDQDNIPEEFYPILYNLAKQLKSCNQLCNSDDLKFANKIIILLGKYYYSKNEGNALLTIEKSSGNPVVSLQKFLNRKNDHKNSIVANGIYEKILDINAPAFFIKSWNLIVEKFVFDKCTFSHLCFEDSYLYLTEHLLSNKDEREIEILAFFVAKALYILTNALLNGKELLYDEEKKIIIRANYLAEKLEKALADEPLIKSATDNSIIKDTFIALSEIEIYGNIDQDLALEIYNKIYTLFAYWEIHYVKK